MTDTLSRTSLTLHHLMSSQSGNLQDLAAYSGHPSSFIIGSESEPDSSSRQEFTQPTPLPSDMGLRYMINSNSDDARFVHETGTTQHTPVYSIEGNLPNSSPSIPFPPFPNVFQPSLSGSTAYSNGSSFFSPSYCTQDIKPILGYHNNSDIKPLFGYQTSPDIKPVLGSFSSSPIMAPPSRSPHLPHLGSPANTRDLYTSATPQLRRASDLLSRSPSTTSTMRPVPLSPGSSSGFGSPSGMEGQNSKAGPPLHATENLFTLQTSEGQNVRPEILGKIDKGFFMADNDWTCYRRNYFQLSCSYTLHPYVPTSTIHVLQGGTSLQIYGFAMSIAAVVDGREGKPIELVQHTPKRDKGPQQRPERVTLTPRPHPSVTMYGGSSGGDISSNSRTLYEGSYGPSSNQPQTEHTFERIQFKQATANNGKRRAAQQYYHLLVELFADVGPSMGDEGRWVKIAQRLSAPMVVRGRSPGHYHSERRPSNAGSAGGSAGGGGGSYGSNGMPRGPGEAMSLSTSSSALPSASYGSSYDQRSHFFPPAHASHIETPMDPIMSSEEVKAIDENDGYLYYPAPLFEGSVPHTRYRDTAPYTLPSVSGSHKIKQEFGVGNNGGNHGYNLPSLTAGAPLDTLGRQCGRFEGLPSSRGYYPTMFTHPEVNTS